MALAPPSGAAQAPAALQALLEASGLARAGETPRLLPLTGGVSSAIWRVDLESGSYCLKQALARLKVAKVWEVPVERVFAEIDWLRCAGAIVPGHVPRVVAEDRAARCFVMEFLGEGLRNWKTELLAGRCDPEVARAVGGLIGRLHEATAGRPEIAARFAHDAQFHALRLEPYLVESARTNPALAPQLNALVERTATTRRALVHGDLSPKNILVGANGPVLLDAECAWYGDPAFDLAFCLNHLLLKAAHLPASRAGLMAAAEALAAAYFDTVRFEPRALLEARVASLLPGLLLARVDGKSPLEYLGPETAARVRAAATRLLRAPPQDLAALQHGWAGEFPS
ncbi:MAG: phosphotransferase [Burkholderiales bacterium]|nr:phosphotransferase [Burkholderiales bacterium]